MLFNKLEALLDKPLLKVWTNLFIQKTLVGWYSEEISVLARNKWGNLSLF